MKLMCVYVYTVYLYDVILSIQNLICPAKGQISSTAR